MYTAIVAALTLAVVSPEPPASNAVPLHLRGRTVSLLAAADARGCPSCALVGPSALSARKKAKDPYQEPLSLPPLVDPDTVEPPAGGELSKPPDADLSKPPDAPSYQLPQKKPRADRPRKLAPTQPPGDVNAGNIVPKEVLVGSLTLFIADLLAGAVIVGAVVTAAVIGLASNSGEVVGVLFAVAIVLGVVHALASPAYAALAVKWMAEEPTSQGLGGAMLGAYVSAIGAVVLFTGLSLLVSGLAAGTQNPALSGVSSLLVLAGAAARWVGVPMAASWAMHRKDGAGLAQAPAEHPRRLVTVSSDGREQPRLRAGTLFAF